MLLVWYGALYLIGLCVCLHVYCTSVCLPVCVCSYYQTESVLIALGITAAVCISISLFAIQTKVYTHPYDN